MHPGNTRFVKFVVGQDADKGDFNAIRHGYVGTIYKGQGRTLDETYLYHSKQWRSASSYVALSRHRHWVSIFVAKETARDQTHLARQMSLVEEKRAVSQFFQAEPIEAIDASLTRRREALDQARARRDRPMAAQQAVPAERVLPEGCCNALDAYKESMRQGRGAKTEAERLTIREDMRHWASVVAADPTLIKQAEGDRLGNQWSKRQEIK
jgi:hypothetical protein